VRSIKEPVVWTNLLFFVNAFAWWAVGFPNTAILICLTSIASFMYHILSEREPISKGVDVFFAYLALVWTVYVSLKTISVLELLSVCLVLVVGLWFKSYAHRTTYENMHTIWHLFVFVGQLLLAKSCFKV
jgi:predicted membrane channel-forming protein YqfA (hemolysin III family)